MSRQISCPSCRMLPDFFTEDAVVESSAPDAQGAAGAGGDSLLLSLQILSLGAGFDSLYFRLKDLGLLHHTVVYEVDFPCVVSRKAALIRGAEELSVLVGDAGGEPGRGSGEVSVGTRYLGAVRKLRCVRRGAAELCTSWRTFDQTGACWGWETQGGLPARLLSSSATAFGGAH